MIAKWCDKNHKALQKYKLILNFPKKKREKSPLMQKKAITLCGDVEKFVSLQKRSARSYIYNKV